MKLNRKMITVLAASLFTAAVPMTAFGNVICHSSTTYSFSYLTDDEEDQDVKSSSNKEDLEDSKSGPGMVNTELQETADPGFSGPSVNKVDLKESYHELYNLYEESIAGMFFLYSNVGNGSVTHESVTIDIPANVLYTVEKDGLPYEYVSKGYISQKGTYVIRLTACENPDMPMSEQIEYQSVFRFRIADPPPTEAAEEVQKAAEEVPQLSSESIWGSDEKETEPQPKEEETEAVAADAEVKETEAVSEEPIGTGAMTLEGFELNRSYTYVPEQGVYQTTLENGLVVTSNVPEGYIGSASVELSIDENALAQAVLYKNDAAVEFINGSSIAEAGSYRLDAAGSSFHFTVAEYVNSMDYYPAPAGMKFTEVRVGDQLLNLKNDQMLEMTEEGIYAIQMSGENGDILNVALVKDYTAPEASVNVGGGAASIQYLSDDIAGVRLFKDKKLVEGFAGTSISEPGKYYLELTDGAGNVSSYNFTVKYQINMYGILAVVLMIGVIAGGVAFVMHTKKNMKIR